MISPLHFLPYRVRVVLFWTVGMFWFLLFTYGTIRLLLAREWASAMIAGGFTIVYLWSAIRLLRIWRAERARELESARPGTESGPIESLSSALPESRGPVADAAGPCDAGVMRLRAPRASISPSRAGAGFVSELQGPAGLIASRVAPLCSILTALVPA